MTTHVMDEIHYCDRAALIQGGDVLICGTIPYLQELGNGTIENLFFDHTLCKKEVHA